MKWVNVCASHDLQKNAGVCALVNGKQVAIFYLTENIYALGNFDPFSKANVLARGIVGDLKGQLMVASPVYKHHFSLETGLCLEDEKVNVPVYPSRIHDGMVQLSIV